MRTLDSRSRWLTPHNRSTGLTPRSTFKLPEISCSDASETPDTCWRISDCCNRMLDTHALFAFQEDAHTERPHLRIFQDRSDLRRRYAHNCGDRTDCTAATSGSMYGALHGVNALPGHWSSPLNDTVRSAITGNDHSSLADLADRTFLMTKGHRENTLVSG